MMQLLDGVVLKLDILKKLKSKVNFFNKKPGLAVVLVGQNPASQVYVSMKRKACEDVGIRSFFYELREEDGESCLLDLVQALNKNTDVHGILVQFPLPQGYDEQKVINLILPEKDVDGFHPINLGKVLAGLDGLSPCTPAGICALLQYYQIETVGRHVAILGRSNIVGKPLAAMLMQNSYPGNATVTVMHSKSINLDLITRQADIVIAAVGKPLFVKGNMVKQGAIVIDVGIHRLPSQDAKTGYHLVGDVDFEDVKNKVLAISPVPGGVGPLTIAMLMKNTVKAFELQEKIST